MTLRANDVNCFGQLEMHGMQSPGLNRAAVTCVAIAAAGYIQSVGAVLGGAQGGAL